MMTNLAEIYFDAETNHLLLILSLRSKDKVLFVHCCSCSP